MTVTWLRRAFVTAACASAALLAACGSGNIESRLEPARIIVFGDAFSDVGFNGSKYTVNDGSTNTWAEEVAIRYGRTVTPASSGGLGYARGNARVTATTDAAGGTAAPISEQINTFTASGTFGDADLVLINGGISDLIAQTAAFTAGAQTSDALLANAAQAGTDFAAQVRRLVNAGARYVGVVGPYNLGRSPWAREIGQTELLETATSRFNEAFKIAVVDLGANVRYIDSQFYLNLVTGTPSGYSLNDSTTVVCTSVDAGAGIGTGVGQVNSSQCNTGTLAAGLDYTRYLFADRVYLTPRGNQLFGDYAYDQIRSRF